MIEVLRPNFTKNDLLKLSPKERSFFLLLGYTSNQVNVLWKLIIAATNRNPVDPIDERVSAAQTQILVRLLIGVLRETWGLVEKRFLQSDLGREFVPLLDAPSRAALESLKKRFGNSNVLVVLRNNYAFHHPTVDDMESAFQQAAKSPDVKDDEWSIYLSPALLNCFFFMSDLVIAHGVANAVGEGDVLDAHRKLLPELAPIANELSELTYGFAAAIFLKHIGNEMTLEVVAKLSDAPNVQDVTLPYFVETSGLSLGGK